MHGTFAKDSIRNEGIDPPDHEQDARPVLVKQGPRLRVLQLGDVSMIRSVCFETR